MTSNLNVHAMQDVCNDILIIMQTYHEQESSGNIDTPGGLEHMGEVWQLFHLWERILKQTSP